VQTAGLFLFENIKGADGTVRLRRMGEQVKQ